MVLGGATRTRGVFPFGLGGQSIRTTGFRRELLDEALRIAPGDSLDGQAVALKLRGLLSRHGEPLRLGNLIFADCEGR
jgi:hypothetical protein